MIEIINIRELKYIGSFNVTSNELTISDFCYAYNSKSGYRTTALNGKYNVYIKQLAESNNFCSGRVSELIVLHEDINQTATLCDLQINSSNDITVDVDSGTMSISDSDYYKRTHETEEIEDEYYNKIIINQLDNNKAITFDNNGCCSDSGFGDGSYPVTLYQDENKNIIGVKVAFIEDVEDEFEDVWYGDDDDDDDDDFE
jgi:hypothetical protein